MSLPFTHHGAPRRASAQSPFNPAGLPPIPMVFEPRIKEHEQWEYHVVSIDLREDEPLAEGPLAALGSDGWLLAGILQAPGATSAGRVIYYFVRSVL